MKKSLEIKKEIEELSKNDNDLEKINKLKKEYIKLYFLKVMLWKFNLLWQVNMEYKIQVKLKEPVL